MSSVRRCLPLLLVSILSSVPAAAASYFYAVGSNNHLYEVSDSGVQRDVRDLSGLVSSGLINGAAFDAGSSQFYFSVPGTGGANGSLWYWNQATNATPVSLGLLPTATPDNGAYWDGAYWYVQQGTNTLHRVALNYTSGTPTGLGSASTATLVHSPALSGGDLYFGDIAIKTLTGTTATLYGATANGNQFFSVGLSSGEISGNLMASLLGTVGSGAIDKMQLSFDSTGTTLYGHSYSSTGQPSGQWFTINTDNGTLSAPLFTTLTAGTSNGFQDMGGASSSPTPSAGVPDRGPWLALLSVTLVSLVLARRRR
ncbi:MAG: hypothetical protein FJ397_10330 [Verrucomicrobia bacterium]|nr:hypothetical protein [Verrucomicrobiota bacterium]